MQSLIECVPNFSEGQNQETLDAISHVIQAIPEVQLLHVDPGASAHRTVFTFAGPPAAVVEAAFQAIRLAADRIDMRQHKGTHPRMGATDVCPLIPLQGISLAETAEWARRLGQRVGTELNIPVYLYEAAASAPHRRNLARIRAGEYEGFREKISHPDWIPDFGPTTFQPKVGQTVIGARDFLIAYNVNLNTVEASLAHEVACDVRAIGRPKRGAVGQILRDEQGKAVRRPGTCPGVKAIGWYIPEFGQAQVSTNIVDIQTTPVHVAFEAIRAAARTRGMRVTGSELIGLIPLRCLLEAGRYYREQQGLSPEAEEKDLVHLAVKSLGLADLEPFHPEKKVIEYRLSR